MTHRRYWPVFLVVGLMVAAAVMPRAAPVFEQRGQALINVDANGLGLHGYDPVACFTEGKAVKGDPQYQSHYDGATYYFQSADDKSAFDKEAEKYVA